MKIDRHELEQEIQRVRNELDAGRGLVAGLEARLDWLLRGQELYGGSATSAPASTSRKPTLATAIVSVIRDGEDGGWTASQVMDALRAHGWMPNGASAEHVVRAKLAALARGDDAALTRLSHGVYGLTERVVS